MLYILGSLSLLAYAIMLWKEPSLLDQRQGPAIPYLIFACALHRLWTGCTPSSKASDASSRWDPNQQTEPATHAMSAAADWQPTAWLRRQWWVHRMAHWPGWVRRARRTTIEWTFQLNLTSKLRRSRKV